MSDRRAKYVVAMPLGRDHWVDWRRYRKRRVALARAAELAQACGAARVWHERAGARELVADVRGEAA